MSANSKIEWTTHTFNPWIGCTKVSPGCANCYAESEDKRRGWTPDGWGKGKPRRRTSLSYWKQAAKWNRDAVAGIGDAGSLNSQPSTLNLERPRVFPSLCDWLDDEVPIEWLADFLRLIECTPNLDWLLLTKRPELWRERVTKVFQLSHGYERDARWLEGEPPQNIWLGTSVEDQTRADERIPLLLQTPAAIRFLSCEPLIGPVDLRFNVAPNIPGAILSVGAIEMLDWVIVGGESGPSARPCNVQWILDIAAQCQAASVPVFVKQLGAVPVTENANMFDWPETAALREGKPNEGGLALAYISLDDRKGGDWNEWPEDLRVRQFPQLSAQSRPTVATKI